MERKIVGFHTSKEDDWMAELDCGHNQHVRHDPPLPHQTWVTSEEGRNSKLGNLLDCTCCEQLEWPEGFVPYKKTPVFDENSVPKGLRNSHSTKLGTWGKIHVQEGQLRYCIEEPTPQTFLLTPQQQGIVVPEMLHHVEPIEQVSFFVEFHKKA